MSPEYGLIDGELWECLPGNLYAVSNHGRVMRTVGGVGECMAGRILRPGINPKGYAFVMLYSGIPKTKPKPYTAHKLVSSVFIGARPGNLQVNHIDSNKKNNRVTNLEYVTNLENARHSWNAGRKRQFQNETIDNVRADLKLGMSLTDTSIKHGISYSYARGIRRKLGLAGSKHLRASTEPVLAVNCQVSDPELIS